MTKKKAGRSTTAQPMTHRSRKRRSCEVDDASAPEGLQFTDRLRPFKHQESGLEDNIEDSRSRNISENCPTSGALETSISEPSLAHTTTEVSSQNQEEGAVTPTKACFKAQLDIKHVVEDVKVKETLGLPSGCEQGDGEHGSSIGSESVETRTEDDVQTLNPCLCVRVVNPVVNPLCDSLGVEVDKATVSYLSTNQEPDEQAGQGSSGWERQPEGCDQINSISGENEEEQHIVDKQDYTSISVELRKVEGTKNDETHIIEELVGVDAVVASDCMPLLTTTILCLSSQKSLDKVLDEPELLSMSIEHVPYTQREEPLSNGEGYIHESESSFIVCADRGDTNITVTDILIDGNTECGGTYESSKKLEGIENELLIKEPIPVPNPMEVHDEVDDPGNIQLEEFEQIESTKELLMVTICSPKGVTCADPVFSLGCNRRHLFGSAECMLPEGDTEPVDLEPRVSGNQVVVACNSGKTKDELANELVEKNPSNTTNLSDYCASRGPTEFPEKEVCDKSLNESVLMSDSEMVNTPLWGPTTQLVMVMVDVHASQSDFQRQEITDAISSDIMEVNYQESREEDVQLGAAIEMNGPSSHLDTLGEVGSAVSMVTCEDNSLPENSQAVKNFESPLESLVRCDMPDPEIPLSCCSLSDSQMNNITLSQIDFVHNDPANDQVDGTELVCGLIKELSYLNRSVMAAHRKLENIRRGTKNLKAGSRWSCTKL